MNYNDDKLSIGWEKDDDWEKIDQSLRGNILSKEESSRLYTRQNRGIRLEYHERNLLHKHEKAKAYFRWRELDLDITESIVYEALRYARMSLAEYTAYCNAEKERQIKEMEEYRSTHTIDPIVVSELNNKLEQELNKPFNSSAVHCQTCFFMHVLDPLNVFRRLNVPQEDWDYNLYEPIFLELQDKYCTHFADEYIACLKEQQEEYLNEGWGDNG